MNSWAPWLVFGLACLLALAGAAIVAVTVDLVVSLIARRRVWAELLRKRSRAAFRALLLAIAAWIAIDMALPFQPVPGAIDHALRILTILAAAWFVGSLAITAEDIGLTRYRIDVPDNRVARRMRTQVLVIRRLTIVATVIIAIAAVLLTFPGVRLLGASLLASAGVLSVVAGIAAQSTLGNLIAGIQLAFNGSIRVEDAVVVEDEWGRIEEITLTYVVVHIWDDRRLVLPTTYFTQNPFENWTRHSSQLLGAVELDLDWGVSTDEMRERLKEVLDATTLWDRRASVLQVTDAVGGFVHVRILVTAKDAGTLFDLRCYVREEMVKWLRSQNVAALPRTRVLPVEQAAAPRKRKASDASESNEPTEHEGVFTGSPEAERRNSQFTASVPIVMPGESADDAQSPGRAGT